jgi:hypothetical protein
MVQIVKVVAFTMMLTLLVMAGAVEGAKYIRGFPVVTRPAVTEAEIRGSLSGPGQQDSCVFPLLLSHPPLRAVMC